MKAIRGFWRWLTRGADHAAEDAALFDLHDRLVDHHFTGNGWPGPWG